MAGVGGGEVEPTTRLKNATHTIWNLQKPAQCEGISLCWLGGNGKL